MKLRLKLFVYIGCTFVAISVASYLLQEFFTQKDLFEEEKALTTKILKLGQEKKIMQEHILTFMLDDYKAWVNALLLRVRDYPPLRAVFDPSSEKFNARSWLDSATMLTNNKDIDFVETEFMGEQNSILILDNTYLPQVEIHSITSNLDVVIPPADTGINRPLVAIKLLLSEIFPEGTPIHNPSEDHVADFYVLFDPSAILSTDWKVDDFSPLELMINPLEPYLQWAEKKGENTFFEPFVKALNEAKQTILKYPNLVSEEFVTEKYKNSVWEPRDFEIADEALKEYYTKYQTTGMTWGFATIISSGPFDNSPFAKNAPIGIVRTQKDRKNGYVLLRDRVFKRKGYVTSFKKEYAKKGYHFEDSLNVITPKTRGEYFLGNTLQLSGTDHDFAITLGFLGEDLMRWIAFAMDRAVLLVSDGKLIDTADVQTPKFDLAYSHQEKVKEMFGQDFGEVRFDNKRFFFVKLTPNLTTNFHFYTLIPWHKEFYLVEQLDESSRRLIKEITWKLACTGLGAMVILLFLLDRIGVRITRPITLLARATRQVQEGKLDEVSIPTGKKEPKDEVSVLSHAFSDMVKGLIEKEKVRGVLNKVVSAEIADEILKQDVHLGGEEKEVTVFFADIREFTSLTEKMSPQEVVSMLNACMTRVSSIVDKYQGVIDKYVGDEVMALFGAPIESKEAPLNAIKCALEVTESLKTWNEERAKENLPKVEMGIGIHRGPMVVGNMGAEDRLNYTVMGANVNLCSRLCSAASASEIVVSEAIINSVNIKEHVQFEKVDPVKLKGFTENIQLYHIKGLIK